MNFDRVAPHYRWLETVVFGNQLQRARIAFLGKIDAPRRVLIVGEGNGRFLAEFVRVHPEAAVDCVEMSGRMIAAARPRSGGTGVRFVEGDIRHVALPVVHYDLLVTHFVLDCFAETALREVVAQLARAAAPAAHWLLADFREPSGGWPQRRARFLIRCMYAFFRRSSGIEAGRLLDPSPLLRAAGFASVAQQLSRFGMIKSEWWQRLA